MMNIEAKFFKMYGMLAGVGLVLGMSTMAIAAEDYDPSKYGPEEPIVWEKPSVASFSHKTHTKDMGLDCGSCHGEIFEMMAGAAQESGDFTMDAFAEGKYCGACHDGSSAFSADTNCEACHGKPEDKKIIFTKPVKAVVFDHEEHNEMGLGCKSCHDDSFQMRIGAAEEDPEDFTMEALYDGKYCGSCHDGNMAFASDTRCTLCHIGVMGMERMTGDTGEDNGHGQGGHH
ncbi:MAG: c(7)-type cytochrome triheme domain-containing protein [Desulfurivibrionaceae bacterium]